MIEISLSMKIKYYDSRNQNNFDENHFNRGFWLDIRLQLLPLIDIIYVSDWLNSIYSLFLAEDKYYDNDN